MGTSVHNAMGNVDCYQPVERKLEITRKLLKVFLKFRNPAGIISKNALLQEILIY
jgi:DNA repair photolyase